jgi:phosphoketolase
MPPSSTAARASASGSGPATTRRSRRTWSWPAAGNLPTLETLAAVSILRERLLELKIRVVNVVDLMKLQPPSEHPHGLSDYLKQQLEDELIEYKQYIDKHGQDLPEIRNRKWQG